MPTTLQTKFLEDSQGNKYAPITTPNAVRWPNGDNLGDKLDEKQAVIDSSNKLPASNVSGLATVATSGSYNDLSNKPTTMGASGSSHAGGLVPDTPSTAGTTKFLREDGTWVVPSGGGGLPTGVSSISSLANIPTTYNVAFALISANQSTVSIDGVSYNSGSPIFGNFTDGKELHVFVGNTTPFSITITLPSEQPYILCGEDTALTVDVGEVAEINFVSASSAGSIFVKAVKSTMTYTIPT